MATYQKRLVTEIRDTLGWFPNWPLNQTLQLGMVGYYDSWRKTFEWRTSLQALGVAPKVAGGQGLLDDLYATENAVSTSFSVSQGANVPVASFSFSKKHSLVAQCHQSAHVALDITALQDDLLAKISAGQIKWEKNWVILTEVFNAKGFSALIAGGSNSNASLSASSSLPNPAFNIANPMLGINVISSQFMAYQGVCQQNVTPYFYIHKFTYPFMNDTPKELRRYRGMAPRFSNA